MEENNDVEWDERIGSRAPRSTYTTLVMHNRLRGIERQTCRHEADFQDGANIYGAIEIKHREHIEEVDICALGSESEDEMCCQSRLTSKVRDASLHLATQLHRHVVIKQTMPANKFETYVFLYMRVIDN